MTEHSDPATAAESQDPHLTVCLPISAWIVIGHQLRRGTYDDVAAIIAEIHRQTVSQLNAGTASVETQRPSQKAVPNGAATEGQSTVAGSQQVALTCGSNIHD